MYRVKRRRGYITVYENNARGITVIQGNSGVVYPFYRSTGSNSQSDQTWFPWMGYFDYHPNHDHQLYMVKPVTQSLSEKSKKIIQKYLGSGEKSMHFICRMGNDESLAISCSLGGGEWEKHPNLREEIRYAGSTLDYIQMLRIVKFKSMETSSRYPADAIDYFSGKNCSGLVLKSQAVIARAMEKIVEQESLKFSSTYFVQDVKNFPLTEELRNIIKPERVASLSENYPNYPSSTLGIFNTSPPNEKRHLREIKDQKGYGVK